MNNRKINFKKNMGNILLKILLIIFILTISIIKYNDAKVEKKISAQRELDAVIKKWEITAKAATETSTASLAGPILLLTSIANDLNSRSFGECIDKSKHILINSMKKEIEGLVFLSKNYDDSYSDFLKMRILSLDLKSEFYDSTKICSINN